MTRVEHELTYAIRMDVHEDDKSNTVTATFELPGLKKEDVNIDVHNNVLTISGESKISSERDEDGYAVRERRYGKFSRSIPLPQGVKVSIWSVFTEDESVLLTIISNRRKRSRQALRTVSSPLPSPSPLPSRPPRRSPLLKTSTTLDPALLLALY